MGCLQGSNLGPLLFNIYQNVFFYLNHASRQSMYADEHQLYYEHSNVKDLMDTIRSKGDIVSLGYSVGKQSKYQAIVIG